MAGRKHHFIQQLLLKGFSDDYPRDPCHVWVYRFDGKVFPTATEGYAAERDFYGKPGESDLDDRITALETKKYSSLIHAFRKLDPGTIDAVEASDFVVHTMARAKNLPAQCADGLRVMLPFLERALADETYLQRLIMSGLMGDSVPPVFRLLASMPGGALGLEQIVKRFVSENKQQLQNIIQQNLKSMDDVVAKAHRATLGERLEDCSGSRLSQLHALSWRIYETDENMILGDSVSFAELADGRFKPATEPGDQLRAIWLPVSSRRILVGSQMERPIDVDAQRVNAGAAACSYSSFCAAHGPDAHSQTQKLIQTSTFRLDYEAAEVLVKKSIEQATASYP